jgi:6,7-dimethyl-8-ribityllumazine synthase
LQAADSEVTFSKEMDGTNMRIGIIKTRWNNVHVDNLVSGIKTALTECKVQDDNVFESSVAGAFELPMAAQFLALSGTVDAIICTGVLIKGDTMHFEYISDAVSKGFMNVGLNTPTRTPVIFGVLTCLTEAQVVARSTPGNGNHGDDWGKTAVEMALLRAEALGGTTVQAKEKVFL